MPILLYHGDGVDAAGTLLVRGGDAKHTGDANAVWPSLGRISEMRVACVPVKFVSERGELACKCGR